MKQFFCISLCFAVAILINVGCQNEETYTVSFESNGGTGTMMSQMFAEGEEQALNANVFVRENYNFSGWNTMLDGSGNSYVDRQKIRVTSDMTLYAQWLLAEPLPEADTTDLSPAVPDSVVVVFDANGGSGEMEPQVFVVGVAQQLVANAFVREGYNFVNWNTIADGSGRTYSDSQEVAFSYTTTLYAQWVALPDEEDHAWVDLGLPSGTKWATCNVGAINPEDFGSYYAWGEIAEKGAYTWEAYQYAEGTSVNEPKLTKYCSDPSFGNNAFSDNLTILEASDDAATVAWGNEWRMPTYEEMTELMTSCTIAYTNLNGVNGRLFTGPNGNSIFLPAAGYQSANGLTYEGSFGVYWTGSLYVDVPSRAWGFFFGADNCEEKLTTRNCGLSVRAVVR